MKTTRRQPVLFLQDKARVRCASKVERHWSMLRSGNSSTLNTLSAQFIYCCVSNNPVHCCVQMKEWDKGPSIQWTEHWPQRVGVPFLNRPLRVSLSWYAHKDTLYSEAVTLQTHSTKHTRQNTPHPTQPPLLAGLLFFPRKVVFILSVCKTVRMLAASISFKSASMDL